MIWVVLVIVASVVGIAAAYGPLAEFVTTRARHRRFARANDLTTIESRWLRRRAHRVCRRQPESIFVRPSLLAESGDSRKDGTDPAHEAYLQAACIVEFEIESKWSKGKLQEFIHAVGRTSRNDLAEIEAALRQVFGVGIAGFEEQFVEYCSKR